MEQVRVERLDHLGLIASVINDIGLIDMIDRRLVPDDQEVITPGEAVAGMILNGLGFANRPLSLTPQFFANKSLDLLFRQGIDAEMFNRFKLGRTLDEAAAYGCDLLFEELALSICVQEGIDLRFNHLDTTSFSLTGDYIPESDEHAIHITHGYTSDITIFGIHPGSVLLVGAYGFGLATVRQVQAAPLWVPKWTRETVADEPEENAAKGRSTGFLWLEFLGLGLLVSAAGWAVAEAAQGIVEHTGLNASVVGTVLMGLTNAMPETITSIAAVRRGALTLAVGSVLGGNSFDVLNLVVGDAAYRGGSLYHAAGLDEAFVTLVTIFMTTILLGGMIRRERQGPAGIGWESVLLLVTYVAMIILITWGVNGA